ncbi:MAG: hypothetical protein WA843_04245 [Candidatus Saccharimonadales bacterium]
MVAAFLGLNPTPSDLVPLSSGGTSIVFRLSEASVLKVNWTSMLLSPNARAAFTTQKQSDYRAMSKQLGNLTLPQTAFTATHPLFSNQEAMQIVQPHKQITDPQLFAGDSVEDMAQTIENLASHQSDIGAQLSDFLERSRLLYTTSGLVPDTLGDANLVIDDAGSLLMIDGLPLASDQPQYQQQALEQLNTLESTLLLAA